MSKLKTFPDGELFCFSGKPPVYKKDATEAAFLLGGIGTGNFSIGARGEMRDWEIFNHSGKGVKLPYAFFAIRGKPEGGAPVARVLESRLNPPFPLSHGFPTWQVAGLPRLETSTLTGRYPFVTVDFEDRTLPVKVSLEAFTPFVPLDPDDSGIPAAILRYRVKNPGIVPCDVSVCATMPNAVGFDATKPENEFQNFSISRNVESVYREDGGLRGLYYTSKDKDAPFFADNSIAVTTRDSSVSVKAKWLDGGWTDGAQDFWDDFSEDGRLEDGPRFKLPDSKISPSVYKVGSIAICHRLAPGEERVFEFVISWYMPIRNRAWDERVPACGGSECGGSDCCGSECEDSECSGSECCGSECDESDCRGSDCGPTVRNYYATRFTDAFHAAAYLYENLPRLEKLSRAFTDALYASTLPDYVIDALSCNITVLRSPTCFRIENGAFLAWEGCFDSSGCCSGTCTHVWNYAQTLAFLFPSLERSMRRVEFGSEIDEKGGMAFRTNRVFGLERSDFLPAADGQMGAIIRLYREWKLSGDETFLKNLWDGAKAAMNFAFSHWDSDGDFVFDAEQHNTYDIEFYGPNSLTNSMFYGALLAMEQMALHLGDAEYAKKARAAFEAGSRRMDELLWGGEYYIQKINDVNQYKYQYGRGCLSDQLLGQFLAHVTGLGYILPKEHVQSAIRSVFEYCFLDDFSEFPSLQRTYLLNDEKGLLLCAWPDGGRPRLPMVYADEVWTGIEYQVASHLIYEGFVDEGLTLVKAARGRHDGYRRNPWNEVECGHHYARSMASWGLLTALSGFDCDMRGERGKISFEPAIRADDFTTFWSTGKAWGTYSQKKRADGALEKSVNVLYGEPTDLETV
ncbi:MAG: hypothetical protein LBU58_08925 [Clostridiales bacterium]|jgi:uncharacterized protein (DUF608 family)|nr:hypothetical protein [Clostridiales bacterium]